MSDPTRVALRARELRIERRSRTGCFTLAVDALDVCRGEVLAVLGRNGAGKSSLLRALAGLEAPVAGRLEPVAVGAVTMVFQRPIAFAGSVLHNVRIALRARGLAPAEIDARCHDALEHFGITALAGRRAARLSGGELRRLALARAFAVEPAVLLLDEPFDDLDTDAQESLSLDLRRAVERTGTAVVVVTHDLRRAVLVCDRIAVLNDGALRQQGERDAVLTRPCDVGVARLVGMTNLLPGRVQADGRVALDGGPSLPGPGGWSPGARVFVGVRPEHLKVDVGRGEGEPIGKGQIVERVSDGVLTTIQIAWEGHTLRTHGVAGRGLGRELFRGDTVSLSVRREDIHLLDGGEPG